MIHGTRPNTRATSTICTTPDTQPDDHDGAPIRLCLVQEPALEFASMHGLPVRTYCGAWFYPDVVDEAHAALGDGRAIDCPACDEARSAELRDAS